jgi:hypothetical protein
MPRSLLMRTIFKRLQHRDKVSSRQPITPAAMKCRRKFLRFFADGFRDETYAAWEGDYKRAAHANWLELLERDAFGALLNQGSFSEVAERAIKVESRTNLLFSFEKMALRDALRTDAGAEKFARGLYEFLHGSGDPIIRFEQWCEVVASLPRKQTRVLTWPLVTVFGFLAAPDTHIFLKPRVTQRAAQEYKFDFDYSSRPNWNTYASMLKFARRILRDQRDLHPRDMIDAQSFMWVQGSDEYEE